MADSTDAYTEEQRQLVRNYYEWVKRMQDQNMFPDPQQRFNPSTGNPSGAGAFASPPLGQANPGGTSVPKTTPGPDGNLQPLPQNGPPVWNTPKAPGVTAPPGTQLQTQQQSPGQSMISNLMPKAPVVPGGAGGPLDINAVIAQLMQGGGGGGGQG